MLFIFNCKYDSFVNCPIADDNVPESPLFVKALRGRIQFFGFSTLRAHLRLHLNNIFIE